MSEPIYRRIADDLRARIESGRIGPGDRLPTELELADAYQASRNTVRDAVRWLINRGLVETRPGQGTFAAWHPEPFVTTLSGDWEADAGPAGAEGQAGCAAARHRPLCVSDPQVEIRLAETAVARRLAIDEGATVVSRRQQRYIDRQPWTVQTSYYPMTLVERGARRLLDVASIGEGTVRYLEEVLHMKQVGYRDEIVWRRPDEEEARLFRLPEDGRTPVAVLLRTGYTRRAGQAEPYRLPRSVFPADRNTFVINAGEVPDRPTAPAGS